MEWYEIILGILLIVPAVLITVVVLTQKTNDDGLSSAIVGGSAAEGDARATALVTMGLSEALDYARSHVDVFGTVFLWYDAVADAYTVYSNAGDALLMHAEGLSVEVIA